MTKAQRRMILRDAESIASGRTTFLGESVEHDSDLWTSFWKLFEDGFGFPPGPMSPDSREHRVLCLLLLLEMDGE